MILGLASALGVAVHGPAIGNLTLRRDIVESDVEVRSKASTVVREKIGIREDIRIEDYVLT